MNAQTNFEYIGNGIAICIKDDKFNIAQLNDDGTSDVVCIEREQWQMIINHIHKFNFLFNHTGGTA